MAGSVGQYTQGAFGFVGHISTVGTFTRQNATNQLGMGNVYNQPSAVNNEIRYGDLYLDAGTWKMCSVMYVGASSGVFSWQLDGVTIASRDNYLSANLANVYTETTGIVVTAGLKQFKGITLSKNASSSSYDVMAINSWCFIRTGGIASTPGGTDTPGYTWEWFPWMGWKASPAGAWGRVQDSAWLAGGYADTATQAQNDAINTDVWIDAGTLKIAQVHEQNTTMGICHIQFDGSDVATMDGYGGATANVYTEVAGIAVAAAGVKNVQLKMATKNASASAYGWNVPSVKIIRTGA